MNFSPRRAADSLAKALDEMGLGYRRDMSSLSSSQYIDVTGRHDCDDDARLKIRFSTHAAKPTYEAMNGAADCEIGTHEHTASTDWKLALAHICRTYAVAAPARFRSFVAQRNAAVATLDARRVKTEAAIALSRTPEFQAAAEAEARRLCALDGFDFDEPSAWERRGDYQRRARRQLMGV
jgi:hypothetical protein